MNKAFLLIVTVVCATVICKTFLTLLNLVDINHTSPIPLAARSKAWACSSSPAEFTNSSPGGDVDISLLWLLFVVLLRSPGVFSAKERRSEGSNLDSQKRQYIYIHERVKLSLENIRFPITWERDEFFSSRLFRLLRSATQKVPLVADVKNVWSYLPNTPFALWHVHKHTGHKVLRSDPLLQFMSLNGLFEIRIS